MVKAKRIRHVGCVYGCCLLKSTDIGEVQFEDGSTAYITWGRNLNTAQAATCELEYNQNAVMVCAAPDTFEVQIDDYIFEWLKPALILSKDSNWMDV